MNRIIKRKKIFSKCRIVRSRAQFILKQATLSDCGAFEKMRLKFLFMLKICSVRIWRVIRMKNILRNMEPKSIHSVVRNICIKLVYVNIKKNMVSILVFVSILMLWFVFYFKIFVKVFAIRIISRPVFVVYVCVWHWPTMIRWNLTKFSN